MFSKAPRGFLLIDLLILILLVGLVMAIVVPKVQQDRKTGYELLCRSYMKSLATAEGRHLEETRVYTDNINELAKYLPEKEPVRCPMDGTDYAFVATDSSGYGLKCPNGHGKIENGKPSWAER